MEEDMLYRYQINSVKKRRNFKRLTEAQINNVGVAANHDGDSRTDWISEIEDSKEAADKNYRYKQGRRPLPYK